MIFRLAALFSLAWLSGCSEHNNLMLGRVQATVGNHEVVVTDCYRTNAPAPERLSDGSYRYTPCKDADVLFRRDELVVNNVSYGHVNPNDAVLVDHGKVSIERRGK